MEIIGPVYRHGDTLLEEVIFPNGYSVKITFEDSVLEEDSDLILNVGDVY